MKSIANKPIFLLIISLIVVTGCKKNNNFSSSDQSSNSSSTNNSSENSSSSDQSSNSSSTNNSSENSSSSDQSSNSSSTSNSSETGVIDWSKNEYYSPLTEQADDISELAHLLRKTLRYQTYGDARYNYAVDSKTGYQYVLYETTGKKVQLTWGDGGQFKLEDGTSYKIEREHILPKSNMRIRPVNGSNIVNTFPTFELDSDSSFYTTYSSKSINNAKGHHTDWHNLWNAVGTWNGSHSNTFYGAPNLNHTQVSPGNFSGGWYPGAEFIGDVARAIFYMTLTYPFVTLVDSSSNKGQNSIYYGYLDYLLKWNEIDPVSPEELDRNNKIFAKQKNRNPFIDFYDQDIASYIFANGDPEVPQVTYS